MIHLHRHGTSGWGLKTKLRPMDSAYAKFAAFGYILYRRKQIIMIIVSEHCDNGDDSGDENDGDGEEE